MSLARVSLGASIFVLVNLLLYHQFVFVLPCTSYSFFFSGFLDFVIAIIFSILGLHFTSFSVQCFLNCLWLGAYLIYFVDFSYPGAGLTVSLLSQ